MTKKAIPPKAWGSVFIPDALKARFANATPYERLSQLIRFAADNKIDSVTVYLEDNGANGLVNFGILTVNLADLNPVEMRNVIQQARDNNVYLDLHAPWLSGNIGRGSNNEVQGSFAYPDPTSNPRVFSNILDFCQMYHEVTGQRLELTIHTSAEPDSWAPWIRSVGRYASINVENGFTFAAAEQPAGASYPADGLKYFNASRPYTRAEYSSWTQGLIRAVNDRNVNINALVDIAHAAVAQNDPLAYVYFLHDAIQAGIPVQRLHLASYNLEGTTLGTRDNHGTPPEFGRQAALDEARRLNRYDEMAPLIDRVFSCLETLQQDGRLGITVESKTYLA
ncbi:MAG: hypothetical protein PHH60_03745 [Candidatus Margulisbacteria bacterium]|nr:hypothetical protein [Candidatus Margulisiibacteriota bacterium]